MRRFEMMEDLSMLGQDLTEEGFDAILNMTRLTKLDVRMTGIGIDYHLDGLSKVFPCTPNSGVLISGLI